MNSSCLGLLASATIHPWSRVIITCSTLVVLALPSQVRAEAASFRDFPVVIFCNYNDREHAYYFSQLDADGRAIYMTPDRVAGSITLNGVAEPISDDRSGTCADKTLEDLRAAGQAFDLKD
jgi:hypothetical protein